MFPVKRPCGSPQRSPPSPAPTPEKVSFSWPEPRGGWHAGNLTGLGVARAELRASKLAPAKIAAARGQPIGAMELRSPAQERKTVRRWLRVADKHAVDVDVEVTLRAVRHAGILIDPIVLELEWLRRIERQSQGPDRPQSRGEPEAYASSSQSTCHGSRAR